MRSLFLRFLPARALFIARLTLDFLVGEAMFFPLDCQPKRIGRGSLVEFTEAVQPKSGLLQACYPSQLGKPSRSGCFTGFDAARSIAFVHLLGMMGESGLVFNLYILAEFICG